MKTKRIIALGLSAVLAISGTAFVYADEIDDLEAEQAYTESQLANVNSSIGDLQEQKNEILGEIDSTDAQLVLTIASINALNTQIDEKNVQIEETTAALGVA